MPSYHGYATIMVHCSASAGMDRTDGEEPSRALPAAGGTRPDRRAGVCELSKVRKVRIEAPTGGDRGNGAAQPALLTVRQTADLLTVSTRTVYNLITEGKLPHYRIANAIRLAGADVEDYLEDCRVSRQPLVMEHVAQPVPRVKNPRAARPPFKTSHLMIGPRQLALLRRGGAVTSGPGGRSDG